MEINSIFDILDFISNIKFRTGVKSFKASSKIFNNLSSGNSIPHPSTIVISFFEPLINISIFSEEELETDGKKTGDSNCAKISKTCYFCMVFFLLAYCFNYIHTIFTIYQKIKINKALAINSWIKNDWQNCFKR